MMQELSSAMIEFFDLVIEKYITHFANPKREWNYFKSLLQSTNIDLNRIQSYLKVLKNSAEQTKQIEPVKMDNYLTYVSPLREHNRPIEQHFNNKFENTHITHYLSQPRLEPQQVDTSLPYKKITQKIVNLMEANNIPLALTKEPKEVHRQFDRKYTDVDKFKYSQQLSF